MRESAVSNENPQPEAILHPPSRLRRAAQVLYQSATPIVVLVAILLIFPSPYMVWGIVGMIGFGVLRWTAYGQLIPSTRATVPLIVLAVTAATGFAISPAPASAIVCAAQLLAGTLVFFTLQDHIHSPADLGKVTLVFVLTGLLLVLAAPFTVSWNKDKVLAFAPFYEQLWPRITKTTNPNMMAGALAPIVPLALVLLGSRRRMLRIVGGISLVPLFVALVLLQSRGALIALGIGLAIYLALHRKWALPLIPLAVLLAAALLGPYAGKELGPVVLSGNAPSVPESIQGREQIWVHAVPLLLQSPLVGIGLGAFPQVANVEFPPELRSTTLTHAHNLFLQVALDTGLIGLAAFLALIVLAIRSAWGAYRQVERPLAIGVLASLAVILVHGLMDTIVWDAKPAIILWMVLGLAIGFQRVGNRESLLSG